MSDEAEFRPSPAAKGIPLAVASAVFNTVNYNGPINLGGNNSFAEQTIEAIDSNLTGVGQVTDGTKDDAGGEKAPKKQTVKISGGSTGEDVQARNMDQDVDISNNSHGKRISAGGPIAKPKPWFKSKPFIGSILAIVTALLVALGKGWIATLFPKP